MEQEANTGMTEHFIIREAGNRTRKMAREKFIPILVKSFLKEISKLVNPMVKARNIVKMDPRFIQEDS